MLTAPSHDLGVVGWVAFALIWLGTTILVLQAELTALRTLLRFFERRDGRAPTDPDAPSSSWTAARMAARGGEFDRIVAADRVSPLPLPLPVVHVHVDHDEPARPYAPLRLATESTPGAVR